MRIAAWLVAAILALTATACSTSKSSPGKSPSPTSASGSGKTMPNVTGQKLDKAEDAIGSAGGDPDKVKEIGGGRLGIVIKSNWTVCSQVPAAGEPLPATPQLTVERSCSTTTPTSSAPTSSTAASSTPSTPATLTVKNSPDLAALLAGDNCTASVATFAKKYAGRDIEFDGNVQDVAPHSDPNDIRHDFLIAPGKYDPNSAVGPSFQFQNVDDSDLHLTGAKELKKGDELHIVAEVGEYEGDNSCLFQLTPVSIKVR